MQVWEQYSYRVFWSEEDREYVGVCAELPGLSWLAKSAEEALRGIRRAARDGVKVLQQDGDPVPEPIAARSFSGVFKVRVPSELHRRLVLEASEQRVSLNRLVSAKLAAPAPEPAPRQSKRSSGAPLARRAGRRVGARPTVSTSPRTG